MILVVIEADRGKTLVIPNSYTTTKNPIKTTIKTTTYNSQNTSKTTTITNCTHTSHVSSIYTQTEALLQYITSTHWHGCCTT